MRRPATNPEHGAFAVCFMLSGYAPRWGSNCPGASFFEDFDMRITLPILFAVVSGLALAIPASAQQAGDATTATGAPQDANLLTPEELQTLVAPVALYPDTLLIQVLIGATAPLDVIKADRLLTDNEGTDQAELGPLVEAENYDESVEVLAMAFPTVLQQMAVHIDWTEAVGAAMLAQSDDVMDAVQVKRNEAIASGALTDTPQQVITNEANSDVVVIQPANPEVVYVPQYDPQVVYSQPSNGVNDALAGGLMFFGTVALIDNIFDDDDDWHGYWGCRDCGGWGGGPIYRNPDIDIDVDGNVNIGNRLDIDRDKVKIDRDKMKIDPDRRPDGGWQPSKDKSDAARDRISNHRKPDGSTKMQLDRPASRSDELRNKLSKEGIGNGRGPGGQGFGVLDDLGGVVLEAVLLRLVEGDGQGRRGVIVRPALQAGKHGAVDGFGVLFLGHDHAAAGAAQGFVRGRGDDIGESHRAWVGTTSDEAGDVGDVCNEDGADLLGNVRKSREVDDARNRGAAGPQQLGLLLLGDLSDLVEVDAARLLGDRVLDGSEELAGDRDLPAVGEVTTGGKGQAHHRVAGLAEGHVGGEVGGRSGVGLHVGVVAAEERLGALDGESFDAVDILLALVVAASGVALGVLVRESGPRGGEHGIGHEVLRRNEPQLARLALVLFGD